MKHVEDFFNMESDAMDTYFECSVCHEEKELEEVEVDDFGEFILDWDNNSSQNHIQSLSRLYLSQIHQHLIYIIW